MTHGSVYILFVNHHLEGRGWSKNFFFNNIWGKHAFHEEICVVQTLAPLHMQWAPAITHSHHCKLHCHAYRVTHHPIASSATCTTTFAAENDGTPGFEHRVPKTRAWRAPFPPPRCGLPSLEHAGDMLHQCNYYWMSIPQMLFMAFLIICFIYFLSICFDSCTDVIFLQLIVMYFSQLVSQDSSWYFMWMFIIHLILSVYSFLLNVLSSRFAKDLLRVHLNFQLYCSLWMSPVPLCITYILWCAFAFVLRFSWSLLNFFHTI